MPSRQQREHGRALTSSIRALMMVFQCLMVVMESGWQMDKMASPMLVALFKATRFSSRFFMNSCRKKGERMVSISPLAVRVAERRGGGSTLISQRALLLSGSITDTEKNI